MVGSSGRLRQRGADAGEVGLGLGQQRLRTGEVTVGDLLAEVEEPSRIGQPDRQHSAGIEGPPLVQQPGEMTGVLGRTPTGVGRERAVGAGDELAELLPRIAQVRVADPGCAEERRTDSDQLVAEAGAGEIEVVGEPDEFARGRVAAHRQPAPLRRLVQRDIRRGGDDGFLRPVQPVEGDGRCGEDPDAVHVGARPGQPVRDRSDNSLQQHLHPEMISASPRCPPPD